MHILWDVLRLLKWLHKVSAIFITHMESVWCQSFHFMILVYSMEAL